MAMNEHNLNPATIRATLDLTLADTGFRLALYASGLGAEPIPPKTVLGWEANPQTLPEWAIRPYALMIVDEWASERHAAPFNQRNEIDEVFGGLLNRNLGCNYHCRRTVINRLSGKMRELYAEAARKTLRKDRKIVESMYGIKLSHVFN